MKKGVIPSSLEIPPLGRILALRSAITGVPASINAAIAVSERTCTVEIVEAKSKTRKLVQ